MKFNVIIKIYTFLFLIFFISSLFADSHVDSCTITNGVFDKTQVIDNGRRVLCKRARSYEIVAYEMYLCTAAPTAPTTSSSMGLDNCFKNWETLVQRLNKTKQ